MTDATRRAENPPSGAGQHVHTLSCLFNECPEGTQLAVVDEASEVIDMEEPEVDFESGDFRCPECERQIEPMEPYLILVVNNTEPPEQETFRFDSLLCLVNWKDRPALQGDGVPRPKRGKDAKRGGASP